MHANLACSESNSECKKFRAGLQTLHAACRPLELDVHPAIHGLFLVGFGSRVSYYGFLRLCLQGAYQLRVRTIMLSIRTFNLCILVLHAINAIRLQAACFCTSPTCIVFVMPAGVRPAEQTSSKTDKMQVPLTSTADHCWFCPTTLHHPTRPLISCHPPPTTSQATE